MHLMIKKINPQFEGYITHMPAFNQESSTNRFSIFTQIKYPPLDLVGIFFDKGERCKSGHKFNSCLDHDKYSYDEVIKETNGAENVYFFWRTPEMTKKFKKIIENYYPIKINPELNKSCCPQDAKILMLEDIENFDNSFRF